MSQYADRSKSVGSATLLFLCLVVAHGLVFLAPSVVEADGHSVILEEDPSTPGFPVPNRIYHVAVPGCPAGPACFNSRLEDALAVPEDPRVDAMSYGRDFGHYKNTHSYFLFSVECVGGKGAVPETPLYREPRTECEADIFWVQDRRKRSRKLGTHGKASDENTASPVETSYPRNAFFEVATSLGLEGKYGEPPRRSGAPLNVIAYDFWPEPDIEGDIYFSIDRSITVATPAGPTTFGPADILLLKGGDPAVPSSIEVFLSATELGLHPTTDDIDALAFNLQGESFEGTFVALFPPTGWYSLKFGSSSLLGGMTAGDIHHFELDDGLSLVLNEFHRSAESMGLFASLDADVDSLGHIDPELVQGFSNWTDVVTGTGGQITEEGLLGASVDEAGNVDFGLAFGPYGGSYAISVNHRPQIVGEGLLPPPPLPPIFFEPGNQVLVELAGQKLVRDLIDQVLVQVPNVGNVPPVGNLQAAADPALGTVEWTWTNGAAYDDVEVRLDGELPMSLGAGTVSFVATLPPGEHYLEVRGVQAGTKSPIEFAIAYLDPALIQPPHSLDAILLVPSATCAPGVQSCWDVELSWENPIAYDSLEVCLDDIVIPAAGNCTAAGPCTFVVNDLEAGVHRFTLQGTVAGDLTIESRVRIFVPLDTFTPVQTGHIPVAPPGPFPLPINPPPPPFMPGNPGVTQIPIPVNLPFLVEDIDVHLILQHPNPEAIRVILFGPYGDAVTLVDTIGVSGQVIARILDGFCDGSPDNDNFGTTSPPDSQSDLSIFDGQPANGMWQVIIENYSPQQGILELLELHIREAGQDFPFFRGNCNHDITVDIADPVFLLLHLFNNGPDPQCEDACDANDDGTLDIGDAVSMLQSLFGTGGPLPPPGGNCGPDPTPDTLGCLAPSC